MKTFPHPAGTMLETKGAVAIKPSKEDLGTKRLSVRFAVKAESVDVEGRTFEGLASTWDLDRGGDVIHRGAFKRTLKFWRDSGRVLPLLDSHSYGSVRDVVGKLAEAKETKDGLWTNWEVIDGPDGDEVLRRIKGGFVDGLSIGYRPVKIEMPTDEEERQGVWRHLKEVELREVSVVLWPMNEGARIDTSTVKSLLADFQDRELDEDEMKELQGILEEVGALLKANAPEESEDPPASPASEENDEGEPKGLAPDDPKRLDIEGRLGAIRLRRLTSRAPAA